VRAIEEEPRLVRIKKKKTDIKIDRGRKNNQTLRDRRSRRRAKERSRGGL